MSAPSEVFNKLVLALRIFPLGTRGATGPLARLAGVYSRYVPLVVFLSLLASVFESIGIGLLIPLVTLLLADRLPPGLPGPIRQLAELTNGYPESTRMIAMAATVLVLVLLKAAVQAANTILISWIHGSLGRDVRSALARRILNLEYTSFLEYSEARLLHIISTDSWYVTDAIRHTLVIVPAVVALSVFTVFLAWLDWRLFLLAIVGTVIIRMAPFMVEGRLAKLSVQVTASNYALSERMLSIISDMRTIRAFGQERREMARFELAAERVHKAMFASRRLSSWTSPSVDALTALLFVVLLVASYWLGVAVATTTAFIVLLSRGQPFARVISENRLEIAAVHSSLREVEWLLDQPGQRVVEEAIGKPVPFDQPIRFSGVGYSYPDSSVAIREATFEIRPGVATALIGRSGAGKTTLVNLICRLLEPDRGTITVGGSPSTDFDSATWRQHIAIAGQDIELVEGTVAENIAYARPDASQEEIEAVAARAGASSFIAALPAGYETMVGQQGTRLSGGQRQRIGLARALLRQPDLLILDEAMNAVDAISESEILRLLSEHRDFRTALVVSHRKSTLAACADGIVIEDGRVREAGPLETLAYFREMAGDGELIRQ